MVIKMKRKHLLFLVLLLTSCNINTSSFDDKQSMDSINNTSSTIQDKQSIEENGFIERDFSLRHFEKIKVPLEYDLEYDKDKEPSFFENKLIKSNHGLTEFENVYPKYYSKYEDKLTKIDFQTNQLLIITIFYSITFNLLHVYTFNEIVFPMYEIKTYDDFTKSEYKDNDIEEGYSYNHIIGITISNTLDITKVVEESSLYRLYELEIFA